MNIKVQKTETESGIQRPEADMIQDSIQYLRDNTDFVSTLFESLIGYAIIAADFDGNVIAYNEGARQIYGYVPEEIIGKKDIEIFFPKDFIEAGKMENIIEELIDKGRFSYEGEKVKKDGSRFPAHILFTLTKDKDNKMVGFIEIVQDLTERKRLNQELEVSMASFENIVEKNVDGIIIVDKEGVVKFVNNSAGKLLNRGTDEMFGSQFGFPLVSGNITEIDIYRLNGETGIGEMRAMETNWYGKSAFLVPLRDITETVQLREKLRAMSLHDELTGLYNRRGFLNLAQQQIKIADRTKMDKIMDEILLLFIDLDDLKQINDNLGHKEGDIALIDTARILKKTFRGSDIIARFGGDEFAILALKTREDKILRERLQKNIDAYNALGNSSYTLSISIGAAIYNPEKPCTLDELISRADTLMYEQKKSKKYY